jgi:hypothetical protein
MLDTLQLAIVTYNAYNFAVLNWGDTKALDLPIWYERLSVLYSSVAYSWDVQDFLGKYSSCIGSGHV